MAGQPSWLTRLWARARRAWYSRSVRAEDAVFADLQRLCRSPGYIYALAAICARNDWIAATGQLQPGDFSGQYAPEHFTRTELSPLLGILVQGLIDYTCPRPSVLNHYVLETQSLLKQFHSAVIRGSITPMLDRPSPIGSNSTTNIAPLREAMLYTGDSAYHFQYLDFARRRYAQDDVWFLQTLGASVADIATVLQSIVTIQERKFRTTLPRGGSLTIPALLGVFTLTTDEIIAESRVDSNRVRAILARFSVTPPTNSDFVSIHAFNKVMEAPLLRCRPDTYILFQFYTLMESFYTSPTYWMQDDVEYKDKADRHRGAAAEQLTHDLLSPVLGLAKVHRNVLVQRGKNTIGEIDVLAMFGDRMVLTQVKTKKLTLASREGDEQQIRDDFQRAIQGSYEQAYLCAKSLLASNVQMKASDGTSIHPPEHIEEIYPVCVVAEHYPALSLQTRLILETHSHSKIRPPLVLDVFALDTVAEFLSTPIRFISYLDLRARFREKSIANHELVLLAFHLRSNLWLEDDGYDLTVLPDDLTQDIDAAMYVRRVGAAGQPTPEGILTEMPKTTVGQLLSVLETLGEPASNALALFLLQCSGDSVRILSDKIDQLRHRVRSRGGSPMVSMFFGDASTGVCVQCSRSTDQLGHMTFVAVCEARKYDAKVNDMFGVNLTEDGTIRYCFLIQEKWEQSDEKDRAVARFLKEVGLTHRA